jgi:hypothetical protein
MKISVWTMIWASAMWSWALADTVSVDETHQHLGGLRIPGNNDRRELTSCSNCYGDASKCITAKCSYNKCVYEECKTKSGFCTSACVNGECKQ